MECRRLELEAKESAERAARAKAERDMARHEAAMAKLEIEGVVNARAQMESDLTQVQRALAVVESAYLKAESEREVAQKALSLAGEACTKAEEENIRLTDEQLSLILELGTIKEDFTALREKAVVDREAMFQPHCPPSTLSDVPALDPVAVSQEERPVNSPIAVGEEACHAPIPGPTRLAGPHRVRGARLRTGTLYLIFFFKPNWYLWVWPTSYNKIEISYTFTESHLQFQNCTFTFTNQSTKPTCSEPFLVCWPSSMRKSSDVFSCTYTD